MDPPPDCTPHYLNASSGYGGANSLTFVGKEKEEFKDKHSEYLKIGPPGAFGYSQNSGSFATKSSDSTIRSSAIVTYSAAKNHAMYSTLAPETNLNLAPSNWLRKTVGLRPETLLPGGRYAANPSRPFGGFSMASSHLNKVGNVDVVSDAENIKKLLKMPYSKAHVSMAIHRIGRTLLLENFDIKKYTAEESEWEWFRKFYQELVQKGPEHLLKKKSPESQYDRLMLSKFLYYSIHQDKYGNKIEGAADGSGESDGCREGNEKLMEVLNDKLSMGDDEENRIEELPSRPTSPETSGSSVDSDEGTNRNSSAVVAAEKRWRHWTPGLDDLSNVEGDETFERNISWTFEDLQMLLGTNMPIFGGGKYPAVSLRLRDSNKPINILTGIDYWLDNLICNVPELVMCFHVNGIVQNYEVIKTEDIPNLEHSCFSPQVVKDIAQNILSFLKSNCTKEGHTYWLFKGSGDDVVKLYDLTTLCNGTNGDSSGNKSAESQQNPYIFSVAMLLYKTAINLMQSNDTCDHHLTVKKLLGHCIDLLDHSKYQYVVSSAVCMLSTLHLPEPGLENAEKKEDIPVPNDDGTDLPQVTEITEPPDCDTCRAHRTADIADLWAARNPSISDKAEVASIPRVGDLSIPDRYQKMSASLDLIKSPPCIGEAKKNLREQAGKIEEDCRCALTYIVYGLRVLVKDGDQARDWHDDMLQQLFRNTTLAYFRLAEQASNLGHLGSALRRTKLALESYETYLGFLPGGPDEEGHAQTENQMLPPDFHLLLPRLLSLCGEIQFSIMQDIKMKGEVAAAHSEQYTAYSIEDREIRSAIVKIGPVGKYSDLTQFLTDANETLVICMKCYNTAVAAMRSCRDGHLKRETSAIKTGKKKNKQQQQGPSMETKIDNAVSSLTTTLFRRHGHVANEIGACALNEAVQLLDSKEEPGSDELLRKSKEVWARASSDFADAFNSFAHVGDVINQALVVSNIGRLMRISAQFHANTEVGLLSDPERHYFNQAIQKYSKALALLDPKEEKRLPETNSATFTAVYDNISWELSSCYFAMAQIIQDNAPRDKKASDDAEKEVIALLTKSLKYCQDIWAKIPKQTLALYRQSKIHYRMASLHHNAYKHCTDSHRCRNLRNLADKHYEKSLVLLEGLENPNEWIRVSLERLALREQYITNLGSSNQKIKILTESLGMMGDCIKPLQMIERSTQVATKESFSSRVDAREQSPNTTCDVDVAGISECSGLLRIMTIILQSFLRTLVKLTTASANADKGVKIASKSSQIYKELYSRTLRALQPLKSLADDERAKLSAPDEGALTKLQENVTVVIGVLKDVATAMAK